jgi:hypothetical protein
MSEPTVTLSVSALEETLRALLDLPCTFWACKGPDTPFEDMITCRICAAVQDIRQTLADAQEGTMSYDITTAKWTCGCGAADHHSCLCAPKQATSVVYSTDTCYVIQREHIDYNGKGSWVDSSSNYYGEHGKAAALTERDRMRGIFGQDAVQVVQRDTTVTQKVIEAPEPVGEEEQRS